MEEVLGIILLVVTIIVSLPIVGFMIFCGADWRQERKFKKYQKEGLSKEGLEEWRKRRI